MHNKNYRVIPLLLLKYSWEILLRVVKHNLSPWVSQRMLKKLLEKIHLSGICHQSLRNPSAEWISALMAWEHGYYEEGRPSWKNWITSGRSLGPSCWVILVACFVQASCLSWSDPFSIMSLFPDGLTLLKSSQTKSQLIKIILSSYFTKQPQSKWPYLSDTRTSTLLHVFYYN